MIKLGLIFGFLFVSSSGFAQERLTSTVREVTAEYAASGFLIPELIPTPSPRPPKPTPTPDSSDDTDDTADTDDTSTDDDTTSDDTSTSNDGTKLGHLIALGEKIWDFIISNKPNSEYKVLKTSIVPKGITSWSQISLAKSKIVSKVYRVEFTNLFGKKAGGFDYRLTYIANGSYKGKGKFIGQLSVVPLNIHLKTDRTLQMKAELLSALNFGTEEDPIAGAQILVSWSTPTTTRYEMNSAEYIIRGSGEIEDLSNGN